MNTCHGALHFWLIVLFRLFFLYNVKLISVIFSVYHFTSRIKWYCFSYMCLIFLVISYSMQTNVSILIPVSEKEDIFVFPFS